MIPLSSSSVHYGAVAIEGIRAFYNEKTFRIFRPMDHLNRFSQAIHLLGGEILWDCKALMEIIVELIKRATKEEDLYLRPIALKTGKYIGMSPCKNSLSCGILTIPFSSYIYNGSGLHLRIMRGFKGIHSTELTKVKLSGNYLPAIIARMFCEQDEIDDVLFVSKEGWISETSGCNVFFVFNENHVATPHISDGVLPGITRDTVIHLVKRMGIKVQVRQISEKEVKKATECFVTGTAMGIQPVKMINEYIFPHGDLTEKLQTVYAEVVKGEIPEMSHLSHCVLKESK